MISFSVIVPNYNHGGFLAERIESILNQHYQHFELILLDDASTDNSREVIEKYRKHPKVSSIVYNEKNSGSPFQQWKKGMELSSSEWVWIAESDDKADPGLLEQCAFVIERQKSASLICVQSQWINEKGEKWFMRDTLFEKEGLRPGKEILAEYMIHENHIKNASAVVFCKSKISRDEINKISGYQWCGDWALWNLLLLKGDFYFIDKPLNYFRRHAEESSRSLYLQGYLYKEGLPLSIASQNKLSLDFKKRARAFISWTGHLLRQYQVNAGRSVYRIYLFPPLYYCILMHMAIPFLASGLLIKKIFGKKP